MFRNLGSNFLQYFNFGNHNKMTQRSTIETVEIITIGFVRRLENRFHFIVPGALVDIIFHYYPQKIDYIGKFRRKNAGRFIKIHSGNLSFSGGRCLKLDRPLPTMLKYNNPNIPVIYRWRARAEGNIGGRSVVFGIVSNRYNDLNTYPSIFLVDAFGISMKDGLVYDSGWFRPRFNHCYKAFKKNEIIRMEYAISEDNKCSLSYYNESKEDKFIWKIDLSSHFMQDEIKSWYPVFSKSRISGLIRVIPYHN